MAVRERDGGRGTATQMEGGGGRRLLLLSLPPPPLALPHLSLLRHDNNLMRHKTTHIVEIQIQNQNNRICNREIISKVQQVICFAFHDSNLLLETCREAKDSKKIVTILFLD